MKDKYDWAGFVQSKWFGIIWIGSVMLALVAMFVLCLLWGE